MFRYIVPETLNIMTRKIRSKSRAYQWMGMATPQGCTKFQDHGYHIGQKRAMQLDFHNYQGSRKKVDMCKVILVRCPRIVSSTF